MDIYYDTEFHEQGPGHPIEFISIGMVRNDSMEYYAITNDTEVMDRAFRNEWLRENVLPSLPWYADYDHVVLAQLFGRMINLPKGFPMYTCDLKQLADDLGNPRLPEQPVGEHNALADARHNKVRAEFLAKLRASNGR